MHGEVRVLGEPEIGILSVCSGPALTSITVILFSAANVQKSFMLLQTWGGISLGNK